MKTRNDCEIVSDCVKRANVDLHVDLCKEIFARKHTATHKPTSAQPVHMCHDDTHTPNKMAGRHGAPRPPMTDVAVGAHGQKNVSESCNRGVMISSRQIPDRTSNFRALFAEFSLTFGRSPRRKNKADATCVNFWKGWGMTSVCANFHSQILSGNCISWWFCMMCFWALSDRLRSCLFRA